MEEKKQNIPDIDRSSLNEAIDLLRQMKQVDKKRGYVRLKKSMVRESRRHTIGFVLKVVAVVLPLCAGCFLWWQMRERQSVVKPPVNVIAIVPGAPKAYLILERGTRVVLDSVKEDEQIAAESGVMIRKNEQSLVYKTVTSKDVQKEVYNKLVVPKGGEFHLVLADGSEVWLNADSKLTYPVAFRGNERKVVLEGEAYFKVQRDVEKPFIVASANQQVRVLGTEFNVCAYPDEALVYTTLVNGHVAVETGKDTCRLIPGEQAVMSVEKGQLDVREVNVEEYVGWKKNMFVFEEQNLEQIMSKLARWYDVTVFFRNAEAKGIVFKGNLPRYADFYTILNIIEKSSNVTFEVKGNVVTVSL
ncbi:FecR family protein [Butyricimonas muris]|uniref:FecR family protein n=1 Tax=Butyricimonas muris TaxID=3378067 RepID=UPI00396780BA